MSFSVSSLAAGPTHLIQLFGLLLLLVQLPGECVAQCLLAAAAAAAAISANAVGALAADLLPQDRVPLVLLLQLRPGGLQPSNVGRQLADVTLDDRRLGGERGLQAIVGL